MNATLLILDESTGSTSIVSNFDESTVITLGKFTLFYWAFSNLHETRQQNVENEDVPTNRAATSALRTSTHTATPSKYGVPSLTTTSRSSAPILTSRTTGLSFATPALTRTNSVNVVSRDSANVEKRPAPEESESDGEGRPGGVSDRDEINGEERHVAVRSPEKHGRRLNSDVSMLFVATMVTL